MTNRLSWRLCGFLSAVAVGILPLTVQPLTAAAASGTGTLFALGPAIVARADPSTGSLTTLANLPLTPPTQPFPTFNGLASDPNGHRLFVQRTAYSDFSLTTVTYQLVTADTQTGATSISADLTAALNDLVFDSSSNTLFGLTAAQQIVRVDPITGAMTQLASLSADSFSRMAVAPATHSLFLASASFATFPPVGVLLTVNTMTGAVSQSPALSAGVVELLYDTSSGTLFGKTFCCPAQLVRIDPSTGAEAAVGPALGYGSGFAIDSASHTIFLTDDELGAFGFNQFIQSINDQTGASSLSGALPADTYVGSLAFEGVAITPQSIISDTRAAVRDGSINNLGVGISLLVKLNAAAAARSRGKCGRAARIYRAFIKELNAQSGKHVAPATAVQLTGEARFLIAHCP